MAFWHTSRRRKIAEWSTAFEKWRYGNYFYYITKGQEHDGRVETVSMTETSACYLYSFCTDSFATTKLAKNPE